MDALYMFTCGSQSYSGLLEKLTDVGGVSPSYFYGFPGVVAVTAGTARATLIGALGGMLIQRYYQLEHKCS